MDLCCTDCKNINNFYEGVEVSVGNWDRDGQWIPLHYFTREEKGSENSPNFGPINKNDSTVSIRGYTVPYTLMEYSVANLNVCGEKVLRDGLQFRWMQNSVFKRTGDPYQPKDELTMDNLSISLRYKSQTKKYLVNEEFNSSNVERYVLFNLLHEFIPNTSPLVCWS